MDINITVLVQILNFWVTYWMLHRFFIRPMVTFIQQKECALTTLQDALKKKESTIQALQKAKHDQLAAFKLHLTQRYQLVEQAHGERHISTLQPAKEIHDRQNEVLRCKQIIMKKVCNVCSCSDM